MEDKNSKASNDLIIFSIKTCFANQIFNGIKDFEFRKMPLKSDCLNKKIFCYSAGDDKSIIGTFEVSEVVKGDIKSILQKTGYDIRNEKNEIENYFGFNNQNCYALRITKIVKYRQPLSMRELRSVDKAVELPQYYRYVNSKENIYQLIKNHDNKYGKKQETIIY